MSEAIHEISEMVGNGYRPKCIMGGFLSADNLKYLAEKKIYMLPMLLYGASTVLMVVEPTVLHHILIILQHSTFANQHKGKMIY